MREARKGARPAGSARRRIRAVVFDFDGTLTRPGALDFPAVKKLLGCPLESTILEFIDSLDGEDRKREAFGKLEEAELDAARRSVPNDGAEETLRLLARRGVRRAVITRNCMASIREALKKFKGIAEGDFNVILSRESPFRPKPHPDGVLAAARALGVEPAEVLMVGDFVFDVEAGVTAGAVTALITNGREPGEMGVKPDYVIGSLREIASIVDGE
jgi:hydrogenase expression/formation protein HypE